MNQIYIYTDGACSGNPGPGGWGAVIVRNGTEEQFSGGEASTTNNKMELTAVIEALKMTEEESVITLTTDSEYVKNGITKWIFSWVRNGWKTASKQPVKNQEYWMELLQLAGHRHITWQWVKGHAGHRENEICDALARKEIEHFRRR